MKNQTEGKYIMKNRQIKNGKWMKAFSMLLAAQLVFTTAGAPVYATGIETETVAEKQKRKLKLQKKPKRRQRQKRKL